MRVYGIVSPQFWTGDTGRKLRTSPSVQVVALYLMTNPHAHMCGLYYLPLQFLCHETGLPLKSVEKALAFLKKENFAHYDTQSEYVWVSEMSHWQVGPIKNDDRRGKAILKWYESLPSNPFLGEFYDRYREELLLSDRREGASKGDRGGINGAVAKAEAPISPSPVLVPVPDQEGGPGETKPKEHGEYGHVKLTEAQYETLETQLGQYLPRYIRRFDRWKEENKNNRKYKNRTAYLTIPNWFENDIAEGKVRARASPEDMTLEERAKIGEQLQQSKGIRYK